MEQTRTAVDNIASLNRPWYNVHFAGGEPTIHPHFFDILVLLHEKLGERLNHVELISNGSRNEELYRKIADISKSIHISMNISIHTEYVDMAHILELIENLSDKLDLNFALMFNPDKREEVHLIYDILYEYKKRFPFNMGISTLIDMTDRVDVRYTQEDFDWQKKALDKLNALTESLKSKFPPPKQPKRSLRTFHDIEYNGMQKIIETEDRTLNFTNGLLEFKDMYCMATTSVLYILETGLCKGMVCEAAPFICNIYEEGALKAVRKDLIHAVKCPYELCNCGSNDCIPKFSSRLEAARFIEIVDAKQQALFDAAQ